MIVDAAAPSWHTPAIAMTVVATLLVLTVGAVLLSLRAWAARWQGHRGRAASRQRQDIHAAPAPRLGGILIVLAVVVSLPLAPERVGGHAPIILLAAALPALLLAVCDDLLFYVSARARLVASLLSGAVFVQAGGVSITGLGLGPLDQILLVPVASLAFTAVCIAVMINAFNMTDGVNGLASSVFVLSAAMLGVAAHAAGLSEVAQLAALIGCAALGFLLLNFPLGYVFLGDAGSYFLGYAAAVLAVCLYALSGSVAAPSILLMLFWPTFEILTTVWRRLAAGRSVFRPDRAHTHTLVFRLLRIHGLRGARANNLAGLLCFLAAVPPALVGGIVQPSAAAGWLLYGAFFGLYVTVRMATSRIALTLAAARRCRTADMERGGIRQGGFTGRATGSARGASGHPGSRFPASLLATSEDK